MIDDKIDEIAKQNKKFEEKNVDEKSLNGDQIIFDYTATIDGNKFEGNEGKGVQIELGKNLFLEGFDNQLLGLKKDDKKIIKANLPTNYPKKELANKLANFECKILSIRKGVENKIDDNFAKMMGAKDLNDLKIQIEKQISGQYLQALSSITKKEILEQIEKNHNLDLPKNLIDQELSLMTKNLKSEDQEKQKEKNEKLAKSRIKLGLILNEIGEKNNLKVSDNDLASEIQKQVKNMPGQEKMVLDYYQKNPSASQSLKGSLYEEKIIKLIKSKIKITTKEIDIKEAESILKNFNKPNVDSKSKSKTKSSIKNKPKVKKISKK